MRWSLDENAPVFWRKSRQAALLRNDPPFERAGKRTLKWLSVFGLCTRREAFAFATSPAAQPATEEVHRWKATVPRWFFLLLSPRSAAPFLAARVPPRAHRAPRTVIQRYQQIAKSQRQTAGKCAKRDELPARRAIRYKLESDRVSYFFCHSLRVWAKLKN